MTANRAPSLWPITLGLCAVALVMAWAVKSQEQTVPAKEHIVPAPMQPQPTIVVHAVLEIPTPAPTPIPTLEPTRRAEPTSTINLCGTATPGAICQQPPLPAPTATAYPLCPLAAPGSWCVWPTEAVTR